MTREIPWIAGPKELLQHAESHLNMDIEKRTGFDLRIAMISVDNAVEVMIKTFLSLPKRLSRPKIASELDQKKYKDDEAFGHFMDLLGEFVQEKRGGTPPKKQNNSFQNFHQLIAELELKAKDKLTGIYLEEIEWFHNIRNNLYHSGNGITVDSQQVAIYFKIATQLFENLFDTKYNSKTKIQSELVEKDSSSELIEKWIKIERQLVDLAAENGLKEVQENLVSKLSDKGAFLDNDIVDEYNASLRLRNMVVHGNSIAPADRNIIDDLGEKENKRDYTKYSFNGSQPEPKNRFVLAVIKDFVRNNPNLGFDDLNKEFPKTLQGTHGVFTTEDKAREVNDRSGIRYFTKSEDLVRLKDVTIAVCSQWGIVNLPYFLERCKDLGINVDLHKEK